MEGESCKGVEPCHLGLDLLERELLGLSLKDLCYYSSFQNSNESLNYLIIGVTDCTEPLVSISEGGSSTSCTVAVGVGDNWLEIMGSSGA